MINEQSKHIGYILKHCEDHQVRMIEPTQEAEDAWVQTIIDLSIMRQAFLEECTPGYYNNEGNVRAMNARNGSYGAGPVAFVKVLEDWRAEGGLAGLELT